MIRTAVLAVLALVALASNAEARQRHRTYAVDPMCNITMPCEGVTTSPRGERVVRAMGGLGAAQKVYKPHVSAANPRPRQARHIAVYGKPETSWRDTTLVDRGRSYIPVEVVAHPEGCPRSAFCGCGAAVRVFGHSIRELWLAANWFKFPRAAPAAGMVAVRRHHVFVLEADLGGGLWKVYDANSGRHLTRIHARSIAGYTVVNPRAG